MPSEWILTTLGSIILVLVGALVKILTGERAASRALALKAVAETTQIEDDTARKLAQATGIPVEQLTDWAAGLAATAEGLSKLSAQNTQQALQIATLTAQNTQQAGQLNQLTAQNTQQAGQMNVQMVEVAELRGAVEYAAMLENCYEGVMGDVQAARAGTAEEHTATLLDRAIKKHEGRPRRKAIKEAEHEQP